MGDGLWVIVEFYREDDMDRYISTPTIINGFKWCKTRSFQSYGSLSQWIGNIPFHFTNSRVRQPPPLTRMLCPLTNNTHGLAPTQVQSVLKDLCIHDVNIKVIHDPNTNISKGCCFTRFCSAADRARLYHACPIIMEGAKVTIEKVERAKGTMAHLNADMDQSQHHPPTTDSEDP